jgi:glycosyltransferase involved in cell wall biosynthesis
MLHAMCKALLDEGHEVAVFATVMPEAPTHYLYDGVEVVVTNLAYGRMYIERWQPDVIVSHHDNTIRAKNISRKLKIPLVFISHNDLSVVYPHLDIEPDLVVFNTEWLAEKLKRDGMRYTIVHPPVYAEQHRTSPGTKVTLVNLNENKGSGVFYELARRHPEWEFLAVEGGHGDQIYPDLPNIELVKQTDNMRDDVWAKTKVLLMPSVYESYGMAGIEALASGIPVICHPTPGLKESQGPTGIFVDRDEIDWWEHQVFMLLHNQVEWEAASKRALKRSAELDPDAEMSHWVSEIEGLVRDCKASH